MFSCEYCEIFKNTYFEEHLQTTTSECSRIFNIPGHLSLNFWSQIGKEFNGIFFCVIKGLLSNIVLKILIWFLLFWTFPEFFPTISREKLVCVVKDFVGKNL